MLGEHAARLGIIRMLAQRMHRRVGGNACANPLLGPVHEFEDAGYFGVDGPGGDQAEHPGHLNLRLGRVRGHVRQSEQRKRSRRGLGMPQALDRRDLHLLVFGERVAALIAEHDHGQRGGESEAHCDRRRSLGKVHVTTVEQVPRGNGEHEHRPRDVARADGVNELRLRHRIEDHRGDRIEFHAHGRGIEVRPRRVLHPRVRYQNPQRGQIAADRHEPRDGKMLKAAESVPSKEEQADEGALEEESHQALDRERHAENVTDVVGVISPVRSELELHRDAGRDTHGEVDAEQNAPESRHLAPDRAAGHHVHAFHDRHEQGQAQSQWHEQEVVHRSRGELQAGKVYNVQYAHGVRSGSGVPIKADAVASAEAGGLWDGLKNRVYSAVSSTAFTASATNTSRAGRRFATCSLALGEVLWIFVLRAGR